MGEEGEEGITQKKRNNTGGRRKEGSHGRRRRNEEGKRGVRRGDPLPTRGKQKKRSGLYCITLGLYCKKSEGKYQTRPVYFHAPTPPENQKSLSLRITVFELKKIIPRLCFPFCEYFLIVFSSLKFRAPKTH